MTLMNNNLSAFCLILSKVKLTFDEVLVNCHKYWIIFGPNQRLDNILKH